MSNYHHKKFGISRKKRIVEENKNHPKFFNLPVIRAAVWEYILSSDPTPKAFVYAATKRGFPILPHSPLYF